MCGILHMTLTVSTLSTRDIPFSNSAREHPSIFVLLVGTQFSIEDQIALFANQFSFKTSLVTCLPNPSKSFHMQFLKIASVSTQHMPTHRLQFQIVLESRELLYIFYIATQKSQQQPQQLHFQLTLCCRRKVRDHLGRPELVGSLLSSSQ